MGTTRTKKTVEKPMVERIEDALKTQFPDAFKPETIGNVDVQEAAQDVLLSVAYTPVVPLRDGFVPCSVVALNPDDTEGNYRVYFPAHFEEPNRANTTQDVSADELRVMRARYLLTLNYLRSWFDELSGDVQRAAMRLYFDGKRPWTPAPGSRLANIPAEGLKIELKPGQTHADLIAELFGEAGAKPGDVRLVTTGDPVETARALGFDAPSPERDEARSRLLGVLGARAGTIQEAQIQRESNANSKPAGHPVRKKRTAKNQQDTLPIAEAFFSVTELPPTTAQSPNPALRSADGMLRAVFAVWYTSNKPDLDTLEPPDELGCYVGAQCGVEAQTAADRLIRQRKGPRSFAWPLSPEFARRVYTDGIRQRTTNLQLTGRQAMRDLGFLDEPAIHAALIDKDVQQAYRRIVSDGKLHPDQGGDRTAFERITLARDVALEYVRSLGEAHGRAGQSNEEREVSSTLGPKARTFLVQWANEQRTKGTLEEKPHLYAASNRSMDSILRVLAKRGYARMTQLPRVGTAPSYVLTNEGMIAAADIERKAAEKAAKENNANGEEQIT